MRRVLALVETVAPTPATVLILAADFAGQTTGRFFTDFAYPTIFAEDPRYYRLIHGSGRRRLFQALEHTFVAQRDSGKHMFNFSLWAGTVSALLLTTLIIRGTSAALLPR